MASGEIDLISLFNKVSKSMKQNQDSLNEADTYNHDHGDNMVKIFEVITQAMKEKKNADPADQLEYAAQILRSKSTSGSGAVYAKGLDQAAKQMTGKQLDATSVISMLETLLAGGEQTTSQSALNADAVGSLLGQLTGTSSDNSSQGIDLGDILGAGMNYMAAKQSGKSDMEAITGALLSGSQMASSSSHRAQSGEILTSTLLSALTSMMKQ
jgi:hypothetical protein